MKFHWDETSIIPDPYFSVGGVARETRVWWGVRWGGVVVVCVVCVRPYPLDP